ncbi:hypothetical protein FQN50_008364 [Emmonsiellopsis sp. PD_5]|nr:hypothetical protein FQN50_008364 [Emmonsiellopsis sp. PD_5]
MGKLGAWYHLRYRYTSRLIPGSLTTEKLVILNFARSRVGLLPVRYLCARSPVPRSWNWRGPGSARKPISPRERGVHACQLLHPGIVHQVRYQCPEPACVWIFALRSAEATGSTKRFCPLSALDRFRFLAVRDETRLELAIDISHNIARKQRDHASSIPGVPWSARS